VPYVFKARLCGLICPECPEPLARVKVRLYRSREGQDVTALAAASPKDTFALVSAERAEEKASSLIAEAETDEQGRIELELGDEQKYAGEAFELDVYLERVPGQEKEGPSPRQFTVTTLQPAWRQAESGFVAAWDYCLPYRHWCLIRGLFGAYTICGRIVHCETKRPIGGVKVFAYDRDWLQDDELGSAMTDGAGEFRIDYPWAAFQPGTFIDIELIGGPDLYFRVESGGGAPLLVESPSRGRDPDRENVGTCFCVELCLDEEPPGISDPFPVFTHVGGYKYLTQIDSIPPGSGLTVADNRAFYSWMRLNGILSKRLNGNPMEYRFELRTTDATGAPTSGWTPIDPSKIARTVIGIWEKYDPAFPGDPDPIKTKEYTVNGSPGPEELVATIVSGWIRVPQESNVFGLEGYFSPNGNMISLISPMIAAWGAVNLTGLVAGASATAPPVSQALAPDQHFSLRMRVREVGDIGPGLSAGTCQHIAIDNTLYDNILHHPSWMPIAQSNALGVAMVDVDQLIASGGCGEIASDLDVLFTAEHPNLGAVGISMSGPGGPYSFTLPAAAVPGQDWFGTATPNFVVANLQPCAYIVTLEVQLLLTTGDSIPDNLIDQIAFCKS